MHATENSRFVSAENEL